MEGAELDFTPSALQLIAKLAKERDTGARGLRSIVEEVMTDIMFDLPELESKEKFMITDKIIRREEPMYESKPVSDKKSA
jgi:ATP-dependent Clp protease ATP-binding subunit ClpX